MNEQEYYHEMDMNAQYEAEINAKAQAEAEYEQHLWKIRIEQINNLHNLYDEKLRELDKITEEIQRLERL